jgi:hypothetical protein
MEGTLPGNDGSGADSGDNIDQVATTPETARKRLKAERRKTELLFIDI